jgi:hypothetical protein
MNVQGGEALTSRRRDMHCALPDPSRPEDKPAVSSWEPLFKWVGNSLPREERTARICPFGMKDGRHRGGDGCVNNEKSAVSSAGLVKTVHRDGYRLGLAQHAYAWSW